MNDIRYNQYNRTNNPSASFMISGEGKDKETGFTVGFGAKVKYKYDYTKSKVKVFGNENHEDFYLNPTYSHKHESSLSTYFGTFGSEKMGYFTLGKTDTLVANFFAPAGETVDLLSKDFAKDKYNTTVVYYSPEFYGVKFAASYGKDDEGRQFAGAAKFNAYGADVSVTGYRQTLNHANVIKGVNLNLGYSMYGASVKLAGSYQVNHVKAATVDYTSDAYLANHYETKVKSIGLEVAYNDFAYAQPYLGAYYSFSKEYNFDKEIHRKQRQAAYVIGAKSDLFSWSGISASAYVEGSLNKVVNVFTQNETDYNVKVSRTKAFQTGVEFKF